ncbi:hypothetical protein [Aquimarina sp. MAR_2010_214]|uniref:hypothetical protein n=1 Tax=Aquimarina sp. MAR_2010_214 TaxID=1250026 RepID=UPI000C70EC73|nr:hypothetical protein [Aquimarina sp. MAR_2010_214]
MKYVFSILLSFLLLGNSLQLSIIYGWYYLDIDSFVEQLCENKERPQLQCNGKCYLTKITIEPSNDQKQLPTHFVNWKETFYCSYLDLSLAPTAHLYNSQKLIYYQAFITEGVSSNVFHPPREI